MDIIIYEILFNIYLKILLISNIIMLRRRLESVELEKIDIEGINSIYALSNIKKRVQKSC